MVSVKERKEGDKAKEKSFNSRIIIAPKTPHACAPTHNAQAEFEIEPMKEPMSTGMQSQRAWSRTVTIGRLVLPLGIGL